MPNPFDISYVKVNKPIKIYKQSEDYLSKKVVNKVVVTGFEDEEKNCPIGSLVPTVIVEKTNIQELINSHVNEVGVANIIARIAKTGDMSLLEQNDPFYGDLTKLPTSDAAIKAKAMALESIYEKLPADLKNNMDISEFVKTMTDAKVVEYFKKKEAAKVKASEGE